MNILLIGNGFDLAHGLPTKYTDFLEFCKMIKEVYYLSEDEKGYIFDKDVEFSCLEDKKDMWDELGLKFSYEEKRFNKLFMKLCSKRTKAEWLEDEDEEIIITDTAYDEFNKLIKNNFWVDYFLFASFCRRENWIDFESEICKMIQLIDKDMEGKMFDGLIDELSNGYLRQKFLYKGIDILLVDENGKGGNKQSITFKELRNQLQDDLNKLIRALEIYLCEFVEKIEIQEKSPDIDGLDIDCILSFNYTHIFSQLYDVSKASKQEIVNPFDYIHGEADIKKSTESNNMVLGIDEFLPDDRKNKDIEFIAFKKFYQRIYKETGCKYKEWTDLIKKNERELKEKYKKEYPDQIPFKRCGDKRHHLYIFGHSLDITDKDILSDLILHDNVYTTIFYHNKDTMGQQIANLVKVIGQDELIRRTGGNTKTIEFKPQQKMAPVNN